MTTLRVNRSAWQCLLTAFGHAPAISSVAADVPSVACKTDLCARRISSAPTTSSRSRDPSQMKLAWPRKSWASMAKAIFRCSGRTRPCCRHDRATGRAGTEQETGSLCEAAASSDRRERTPKPAASVLGAVNQPGVHQVAGHKTLLEMISLAGGVRPDAGYSIRITRQVEWGCIPLPGATLDASGQFTVAQVKLQDIMEAKVPEENIQILPHDVISVPKAELVYVTGDVKKSGGFILGEKQNMSVLQAISMAEGLGPAPDTKHAKILRMTPGADQRTEIPVDLKTILAGKGQDVPLQGNDILFVPDSTGKKVALRALEAAITTGTGLAIYRP